MSTRLKRTGIAVVTTFVVSGGTELVNDGLNRQGFANATKFVGW
jgi:hypothetical protein